MDDATPRICSSLPYFLSSFSHLSPRKLIKYLISIDWCVGVGILWWLREREMMLLLTCSTLRACASGGAPVLMQAVQNQVWSSLTSWEAIKPPHHIVAQNFYWEKEECDDIEETIGKKISFCITHENTDMVVFIKLFQLWFLYPLEIKLPGKQ